jgi:hypothetical protein
LAASSAFFSQKAVCGLVAASNKRLKFEQPFQRGRRAMAGLSRVGRRLWSFAWRNALPQIAVSSAATVIGSLVIATVLPGGRNPAPLQPIAEQARPAAVPLAQLWPRQDPARLFSLALELAPGAMTATAPALAQAAAGPRARAAAPARPDAPKARRVLVAAADVLPPPRPASLTIAAEAAPSEPTESPRLFGLKLPGSLARVGGSLATTVAALGERIWDQFP